MTRQSVQRANRWRRVSGALISCVGVVTAAVHGYHFFTEAPDSLSAVIFGIMLPLCLSLALFGAGYWLARSDYADKHAIRVAGWSVTGAAVLTFSAVAMIQYQQAVGVALDGSEVILVDSVTGGTAIGFVFGIYATRIKRQTAKLDRYQRQLKRERDRFAALFDNLPNPAIQYEHAGEPVIRVVNSSFEQKFGAEESIHGSPVSEIVVSPDEQDADLNAALRSSHVLQREVRLNTATGIRDFQLVIIPTQLSETESTGHLIATDVTESKQYVRRLEVLNRVLRHDLRNEANVIIGYSEMLQDEMDENIDATKAETIHETAYDLVELGNTARQIEHALDRSNETEKPIDLTEVLRKCADCARDEYPNADIRTELHKDIQVSANDQIDSVFDNVIENAIEHNDSEAPIISVTTITDESGFVTIEITDNGPGFPERERQVLEQGTESQLKHSLGLGLWLVNWIVVDSGGKVTFTDNDPCGSVVTIDLPKPDNHKTAIKQTVNE
jgi:PAS domain S-box-containing protein